MSKIRSLNIRVQEQIMLCTLRAKTLIREIFSLKKDIKMTMRVLQKILQNV